MPGAYTFVIFDAYGDGMCDPGSGGGGSGATTCGYYRLYLDGREIVDVSHYGASNAHSINVGYDPLPHMSDRHVGYLDAHNARRRSWHEMHGVSYVPLLWSPGLAEDSARWAEALLDDCDSDDIEHETGVMEGENLAKNKGYEYEDGVPSWGQLYPPESMCFTCHTTPHHLFHVFRFFVTFFSRVLTCYIISSLHHHHQKNYILQILLGDGSIARLDGCIQKMLT